MSFLKSVIADARPRNLTREPLDGLSATPGLNTRESAWDVFGVEGRHPVAPDNPNRLSGPLSIREGASGVNMGNSPAFQADHLLNQGIQDMGSHVESESRLSVMVDKSEPIPDEESTQNRASGHEETELASSSTSIRNKFGNELTDNNGNSAPNAEDGTGQPAMDETMSLAAGEPTSFQVEVARATAADEQRQSEDSIKGSETLTIQADMTQTTDLTSPENDCRIESTLFETSFAAPGLSSDAPENPSLDSEVATVSYESLGEGNLQYPGGSRVDNISIPVNEQALAQAKFTGQNGLEKALAGGGKVRQSPGVGKQADMKIPSNQEVSPLFQKPDDGKSSLLNVQFVARPAVVLDSHISSDTELASVPQSTGKKVSTSTGSPDSTLSKPSSPAPHIAGPAKSSASLEALPSALARPFQTGSMPKDGDTFRSRAPLGAAGKKHETPKVQIGQIDVIIEAATQPVTKQASAPPPNDLASRHYLRRL